ncbi:Calreticulin family protein [Trichomonas vaginalis G3]|uniref:Calreticulin family protein n=1 Tax=Trichomonas vaginalis (strain ATCC PRA-98 / G3) TaxID=412133 RepID=A2EQT6_TRIV3|nr:unfolded protein binding [Trichomonas vaginalis G3]EAY04982.1 Calreticulin family protein [Trichomonas vaginalis G3]KAI5553506.1 unfolded protein binding [Trichomonas vaginalis G3]|eukprot:XP_001317205.1 Calreticulin family protein [Trichomonas vaginalis G3]
MICFYLFPYTLSKKLPAKPKCDVLLYESFDPIWSPRRWIPTEALNYTNDWQIVETQIPQTIPGENALYARRGKVYSAVSTKFKHPINITEKDFVLQYEMRAEFAFTCSGAYIKLFAGDFDPTKLTNETNYALMFGPDRCSSSKKVHFILNEFNRSPYKFKQLVMQDPPIPFDDTMTHLYTLIIRKNGTYSILIDNVPAKNGAFDHKLRVPLSYGLGFEIWHVNRDISFNNILIANDEKSVIEWNNENFAYRQRYQKKELLDALSYDLPQKSYIEVLYSEVLDFVNSLSLFENLFMILVITIPIVINIIGFFIDRKNKKQKGLKKKAD